MKMEDKVLNDDCKGCKNLIQFELWFESWSSENSQWVVQSKCVFGVDVYKQMKNCNRKTYK